MLAFVRKNLRILFLATMSLAVICGAATAVFASDKVCVVQENETTVWLVSCGSSNHLERCEKEQNFLNCYACDTSFCQEQADDFCLECRPWED